jgi:hypothetical protein
MSELQMLKLDFNGELVLSGNQGALTTRKEVKVTKLEWGLFWAARAQESSCPNVSDSHMARGTLGASSQSAELMPFQIWEQRGRPASQSLHSSSGVG